MEARIEILGAIVMAGVALAGLAGCGRGGPKTHVVQGRVVLTGGDVRRLAGSHVEVALIGDTKLRASGVIQEDGAFKLVTLHDGQEWTGARAGKHQVRIILNDDDKQNLRLARQAIAPRFLQFTTSGLTLDVPVTGEVTLTVSAK